MQSWHYNKPASAIPSMENDTPPFVGVGDSRPFPEQSVCAGMGKHANKVRKKPRRKSAQQPICGVVRLQVLLLATSHNNIAPALCGGYGVVLTAPS